MKSSRRSEPLSEPPTLAEAPAPEDDFADLFDAAPCGYAVLSPAGRILRANATLCRWIGRSPDELAGQWFRELLTVPGRIFYETNFAPLLRIQGGFEEVALDLLTPAGDKLPMLVNATERRDEAAAVTAIRVTLFRAKDRRGYERELHARERAALQRLTDEQETAKLREQFIAVLGHDLRNPLASIVGAARLLRRESQSEKALKVIQLMETSVDRMAGLIDDVMDFARGRLGRGIAINPHPQLVTPILQQVVDELEAGHPNRTIICDFDAPHPSNVDEGRLAKLVSNLIANALAHGDPKAPVRLIARADETRLSICIANEGPPIPAAAMARLFQPFFRGEVRASQQGLGLGLHIASEIARSHGGQLSVSSTDEETRFEFVLPLA